MSAGRAILKLTDGTNEIDLLGARFEFNSACFLLEDWRPQIAEWKGGGTWSQSALSEGRQLRYRVFDNITETFRLKATDEGQDALITSVEDVLAALEQAADYWTTDWAETLWYLEARATEETETRYAIVKAGRIPEVEDYYRQPFLQPDQACDAMMDELTLVIERGHWQDAVPGESSCLEIGAIQEWCVTYPLGFNALTSYVNLASPAILDNLPSTVNFTVDGWVYLDSYGEFGAGIYQGRIFDKAYWYFTVDSTVGLIANATYVNLAAESRATLSDMPLDGWHHVAAELDITAKTWTLYVDGVDVTNFQQAGVGAYFGDAAANGYIGNNSATTRTFDGLIGWFRISGGIRWGADFSDDVPPRCPLPSQDIVTRWLGIHEGTGTTIYDLSVNGNNGTAVNTEWGDCCTVYRGNYDPVNEEREETCDEEVYVANKHNRAMLTHIIIDDGGVYSGNLLALDPPYALLPAVPAANDRVYFGIQSTLKDSGPFCSLVFDLSQVQANIADIVWEYWNGAWAALTIQDNTDSAGSMLGASFDTLGVASIHWAQPTDWATTTVTGVTGYWVRAEVQDAGTQPPIQQNRHVYTVAWPFVEVQADKVGGTLPNLIQVTVHNQSDNDLTNAPVLFSDRVIVGLRSVSRGEDFTPYINLADEQNQSGITVSAAGGNYTFQNDVTTPTGRKLQCLNAPAAGALAASILLQEGTGTPDIAPEYFGTYHTFIRGDQTSGAAGDIELQLRGLLFSSAGTVGEAILTDWVPFANTAAWHVLDMGQFSIPFNADARASEIRTISMRLYIRGNGASDCDLFDLILMPTDEWTLDSADTNVPSPVALALGARRTAGGKYLDIDSTWPRRHIRSVLKNVIYDRVDKGYRTISNGPVIAQANARQRYWFLHIDTSSNPQIGAQPEVVNTVQMWNVQRYLSARGNR